MAFCYIWAHVTNFLESLQRKEESFTTHNEIKTTLNKYIINEKTVGYNL